MAEDSGLKLKRARSPPTMAPLMRDKNETMDGEF